jgi:hypothetical protein
MSSVIFGGVLVVTLCTVPRKTSGLNLRLYSFLMCGFASGRCDDMDLLIMMQMWLYS